MSDIGAMVAELIEAGCAPDAAARVVAEAFIAGVSSADVRGIPVDEVAEKRRAYDRERKRRSRGIPPESTGHPRNSESASLSKEESKKEIKEEREGKTRARPRTRLPELWQLDEQDTSYATERGFYDDRLRQMASAFANHHRANGTTMADWHAAWRKWTDNEIKFHGGRNGNGSSNLRTNPPAGQPQTRDAAVIAGMGRALERRRAARAADDAGRQELREAGCAGPASAPDAEPASAAGDDRSPGQLAFLPARHAGGERHG